MTDQKMLSYNYYKKVWENTKPIRGRSEDVRPIGQRRRDWEQVVRVLHGDDEPSFAAKLYGTNVVEYFSNGNIMLRTNGWHTPSTASFIHEHSPFLCWKANKHLWVRMKGSDNAYPIGRELLIEPVVNDDKLIYQPVGIKTISKRVVDRHKAKTARAGVMPFLNWVKAFMTLSDGWIMHETRKQVIPFNVAGSKRGFTYLISGEKPSRIYEMICNAEEDEYLHLLSELCVRITATTERLAETHNYQIDGARVFPLHFYDKQYVFEDFKRMIYKIVSDSEDTYKVIEVMPTTKAMSNVV